jgi:hypothetical protein
MKIKTVTRIDKTSTLSLDPSKKTKKLFLVIFVLPRNKQKTKSRVYVVAPDWFATNSGIRGGLASPSFVLPSVTLPY